MRNNYSQQLKIALLGTFACSSLLIAENRVELVLNPYEGINWKHSVHHKANFHTHTTVSDGHLSPMEVVDEYQRRGYSILAITDHNRVTYPWTGFDDFSPSKLSQDRDGENLEMTFENRDPAAMGMIAVAGNELSDHHHLLSLFSEFSTTERNLTTSLNGIASESDSGLAFLAHPFHSWSLKAGSIHIPLNDSLRNLAMGDFTVEVWFRTTDASRNIPLGNFDAGDKAIGAINLELHSQNRVRVYVQPPESSNGTTVDILARADEFGINTRDGNWHHLAGVRRDGRIYLYLNGQQLRSREDAAGPFKLEGSNFYIGRDARVDNRFHDAISVMTHPTTFDGDLDHIRFWTRGLTEEEIAGISKGKVPGKDIKREGLLAEYQMETLEAVRSLQNGVINQARVLDTAHHPDGPFHGYATMLGYSADAPPALVSTGTSTHSVNFGRSHPLGWQFIPASLVEQYKKTISDHPVLIGIEVHGSTGRRSALDFQLWDQLLKNFMPDRPIWGIVNDDMHAYEQLGRNWSVFPMTQLTWDSIREAMLNGRYYFTTVDFYSGEEPNPARTPLIEQITHDAENGKLSVKATIAGESIASDQIRWISNGKVIQSGPTLHYHKDSGVENYVRVEIIGSGGTTYTNPFGFLRNYTNYKK
jgi:hypothetical protein